MKTQVKWMRMGMPAMRPTVKAPSIRPLHRAARRACAYSTSRGGSCQQAASAPQIRLKLGAGDGSGLFRAALTLIEHDDGYRLGCVQRREGDEPQAGLRGRVLGRARLAGRIECRALENVVGRAARVLHHA